MAMLRIPTLHDASSSNKLERKKSVKTKATLFLSQNKGLLFLTSYIYVKKQFSLKMKLAKKFLSHVINCVANNNNGLHILQCL